MDIENIYRFTTAKTLAWMWPNYVFLWLDILAKEDK